MTGADGPTGAAVGGDGAETVVRPPAQSTADDDHGASVEEALLKAHALIDSTVDLYHRRSAGPAALLRTNGVPVGGSLEQLIGRARHTVSITLTHADEWAEAARNLVPRIPAQVTVRALCTVEAADLLPAPPTPPDDVRLELRVTACPVPETLVVDGTSALVRTTEKMGGHTAVVNDVAAVRALEILFAGAWSRGRGLTEHLLMRERLSTELAREILVRLSEGKTDEAAARELDVSLRTYRRYVARFLRELDVDSRFQAGVRAAELGLIAPASARNGGARGRGGD
ncbi:helix-turn-helix domain-containing protein [Streptomyces coerulescens]|uniref:Helix-turn-helix domain-containing protein n=1 Tax=Streptomyces coerulescens TaxID=29304 RepID=A0ABW0CKJ8_STRCD